MGTGVLQASSSNPNLLAWAHCAAGSAAVPGTPSSSLGVTFALVNLSPDTAAVVTFEGIGAEVPRHEYVLSPDGAPNARGVLLNGSPLSFGGGVLSPTPPRVVTDSSIPFTLLARTYAFVSFPLASTECL